MRLKTIQVLATQFQDYGKGENFNKVGIHFGALYSALSAYTSAGLARFSRGQHLYH